MKMCVLSSGYIECLSSYIDIGTIRKSRNLSSALCPKNKLQFKMRISFPLCPQPTTLAQRLLSPSWSVFPATSSAPPHDPIYSAHPHSPPSIYSPHTDGPSPQTSSTDSAAPSVTCSSATFRSQLSATPRRRPTSQSYGPC
jgi:hypothetical protein